MFGKKETSQVEKHVSILGLKVKDKVTGYTGVITSVSFDLYGCIQAAVTPEAKDTEVKYGSWFDVTRLEILDPKPVMDLPKFDKGYIAEGRKGCAAKLAQH